jgi:hypothetical protein
LTTVEWRPPSTGGGHIVTASSTPSLTCGRPDDGGEGLDRRAIDLDDGDADGGSPCLAGLS